MAGNTSTLKNLNFPEADFADITKISNHYRREGSVLRRPLYTVDDQNFHRPFGRFEFQPELFLNGAE